MGNDLEPRARKSSRTCSITERDTIPSDPCALGCECPKSGPGGKEANASLEATCCTDVALPSLEQPKGEVLR